MMTVKVVRGLCVFGACIAVIAFCFTMWHMPHPSWFDLGIYSCLTPMALARVHGWVFNGRDVQMGRWENLFAWFCGVIVPIGLNTLPMSTPEHFILAAAVLIVMDTIIERAEHAREAKAVTS